jgi:mono/diheme cytochrome c family protein
MAVSAPTRSRGGLLLGVGAVAVAVVAVGSPACANSEGVTAFGAPIGIAGTATGPRPDFGTTVTLKQAPPAITGGTLLMTASGTTLVAADPDRDQVYVVDLGSQRLTATIPLSAGDEPGRLVEDGAGKVHVALRRGGVVATLDLATNRIVDRRAVCSAPRGIAYDASSDVLFVACNGGELVTLPAGGGAATRTLHFDTDLRDVVIHEGKLYVSRLRQAEVLEIDGSGTLTGIGHPPVSSSGTEPDIAWRMISLPSVSSYDSPWMAMVHQRARPTPVSTEQGGYGQSSSGCPQTSIIETTITTFWGTETNGAAPAIPAAVLPVDIAASPDGATFAIVAAANAKTTELPGVFFLKRIPGGGIYGGGSGCAQGVATAPVPGQATAVVFSANDLAWVQTREPSALMQVARAGSGLLEVTASIVLSTESREDTGHSIVHSNSGGFIACASCHAEGGDDGRVWQFANEGGKCADTDICGAAPARRTQSMRGTLEGTAPYHWEGDMKDIATLAHEVFVKRMDGTNLTTDQAAALQAWLFAVPRPITSPQEDAASVARGSTLFHSVAVGCSGCHAGEHYTNNQTLDVGTGGSFQVPSLIGVSWRAPYLHDGRAPELVDRFNPEITGHSHGHTSQLTTPEIDDLVHYLETL